MTNKERRDAQMAYISDESIFEEQMVCRKLLQIIAVKRRIQKCTV